jgi:hypothetical protein
LVAGHLRPRLERFGLIFAGVADEYRPRGVRKLGTLQGFNDFDLAARSVISLQSLQCLVREDRAQA